MKTLFIALASLLLVQGIIAADFQCYICKYDGKCEEEGTATKCVGAGDNCLYSENGENKKAKACYADWKDKPELKAIKEISTPDMKMNGCIDITNQKDNTQAYKMCLCNGNKCNTNDKMKSDMVKSSGEEGERECYSCGDIKQGTACTEKELKEKKTVKCGKDIGNCFVVIDEKTTAGAKTEETFRGCMVADSEKTYGYGSISFEKSDVKGNYYICNKNKCNLDKDSWKDSSVAGLTSSLALLFAGLVSYQLFN